MRRSSSDISEREPSGGMERGKKVSRRTKSYSGPKTSEILKPSKQFVQENRRGGGRKHWPRDRFGEQINHGSQGRGRETNQQNLTMGIRKRLGGGFNYREKKI